LKNNNKDLQSLDISCRIVKLSSSQVQEAAGVLSLFFYGLEAQLLDLFTLDTPDTLSAVCR